jgi:hypothetical protein
VPRLSYAGGAMGKLLQVAVLQVLDEDASGPVKIGEPGAVGRKSLAARRRMSPSLV